MKTVKVERPEFIPEESWQLEGVQLKVDDQITGRDRETLIRRAQAIGMRELRLTAKGSTVYEDMDASELLIDQFALARRAVREVVGLDGKMAPDQMAEFLDGLGIFERDAISNEVVGANRLGRKNGSGSPSS